MGITKKDRLWQSTYEDKITGQKFTNADVYSMSEEQEKWAKNYGLSFNPADPKYYAFAYQDIYDKGVNALNQQRNQGITDMRNVYGDSVEQSKYRYNQNVMSNADVYRDNAIQANSQYQNMANVYGANQDKLAQMGLTGSGYNAYLQGNAYSEYQGNIANAYNQKTAGIQNAQGILNSEVYGYNQEMNKGISNLNMNYADVYRDLETQKATNIADARNDLLGKYAEYKAKRDENLATHKYNATAGEFSKLQLDALKNSGQINDKEYNEIYGVWNQRKNKELGDSITAAIQSNDENAINTAILSIDRAYANGDISNAQRGNFYASTYPSDINLIKNKTDYDKVLNQLNSEKDILGSQYSVILAQLNNNQKIRDILAKEASKSEKAKDTIATILNPSANYLNNPFYSIQQAKRREYEGKKKDDKKD